MKKLFNYFFLIIAVLLSSLVFFYKKGKKKNDTFRVSNTVYKILIVAAITVGLVIRLWQFGLIPGGFNQDGAMAAVDGLAIAKYGTDRFGTWLPAHLYAWGYGQMSSLLSYLMAIFIKLFGLSTIIVRLPQLLVSIMGGIFFYLFMKDIFGKKVGLIAAFFVAVNPWHFVQSRWALDCNLLPHFFMGGLFFLNRGLIGRKKDIYISMIFFALSMYCYGITIYTIPVFLLAVAIYYYINKKLTIKDIVISICIYLFITWPFILTMMVNYFKWDTIKLPFVTIQYFPDSVRSNDIIFFSDNILRQLFLNFGSLMRITILQGNDLLWNNVPDFGTMYIFTIPFVFAGILELVKIKTDSNKALVTFALLIEVWVGLTTNNVNVNRINIIYYGMMMLAVIGIYSVVKEIKYAKWVVPCMYLLSSILLVNTYFTSYAKDMGRAFYDGFGKALIVAEKANTAKIYVTADAQGKGYAATSEILTMFYDKMDAHYFQGKTNINNDKEYLPYKERYHYLSMTEELVDNTKDDDVAYVIMNSDKQYFDDTYEIIDYGDYSAVIKK